ncbi:MAG: PAS domain S-box protein [Candidatus Thorarchaeota archaeon]
MIEIYSPRILLVDDDEELLDVTKAFLEDEDPEFTLETTNSPYEALQRLSNEVFDALVVDYQMPGLNGLQLLEKLRKNNNNVPFIMFTGRGREEVAMQALNLGADYYLMKGGDLGSQYGELAHIIRSAIRQRHTEEALRRSEQKYRELVEKLHEGVLVEDAGEMITFVNPQTSTLLGYSLEELVGQPTSLIIPEGEREKIRAETAKRAYGISSHYEAELRAKNGDPIPVIISATPLFSDLGVFQGVLTVFTDISDRKQTEHELRERIKELNCLYEISGIVERPGITLPEILEQSTRLLPSAWQYPDIAGACISFEEQFYTTKKFQASPWVQTAAIQIGDRLVGEVAVSYNEERPTVPDDEGPFLQDERRLINAIAERLGRIIELKQAEIALRESEETYRTLIKASPDAVTVTDLTGLVTFASEQTAQLHGFKNREDLLGENVLDLIAPEDQERAVNNMREIMETGKVSNSEYVLMKSDGTRFVGELNAAIIKSNLGEPRAIIGTTRDISDRKKAEEVIKASEETFRRTFEAIPHPSYLWEQQADGRLILTQANNAAFEITKGGVKNFIGIELDKLYENRPEISSAVIHVLETGETNREELLYKFRTTAEQKWLLAEYARPAEGKVLVITKDITDRKQDEDDLRRQKKELGDFAHAMAHDLRNQLNHIKGYASLLQKKYDPAHGKKIEGFVDSINDLLGRSLALAEAGQIIGKACSTDLSELIRKTAEETIPENIFFHLDSLPLVTGDPGKITQIFQNLFENAVFHGSPRKIEVRRRDSKDGISIFISNDGEPIPYELHLDIFRRGFTTKEEGWGLGLAIVKKIVEAHGWQIALEDAPETTFRLFIPTEK